MSPPASLPFSSPFLYVLCQYGAEIVLKNELAHAAEGWKPSYSRPGFVTFKRADAQEVDPALRLGAIFPREYGLSLGMLKLQDPNWVSEFLAWAQEFMARRAPGARYRIHVCERQRYGGGEEPLNFDPQAWSAPARRELVRAGWQFGGRPERADDAEWVIDLVLVEEREAWIGAHVHHPEHSGYPGGVLPCDFPDEAPSRAYLKLAESELLWDIPFRKDDRVLEVGASPGGMSYACLERGMVVWGVDPGLMGPGLRAYGGARFHHLRQPVFELRKEQVSEPIDWILLDMNTPPDVSVESFRHVWGMWREGVLGALLVLKLNQWKTADHLPKFLEMLKDLGFSKMRARQLPSNRQEITVYLETKRGLLRRV